MKVLTALTALLATSTAALAHAQSTAHIHSESQVALGLAACLVSAIGLLLTRKRG